VRLHLALEFCLAFYGREHTDAGASIEVDQPELID
jgi:hypothetical protein